MEIMFKHLSTLTDDNLEDHMKKIDWFGLVV